MAQVRVALPSASTQYTHLMLRAGRGGGGGQNLPSSVVSVLLGVLRNRAYVDHLTDDALGAPCGGGGFARNLELAAHMLGGREASGALAREGSTVSHAEAVRVVAEYVMARAGSPHGNSQ